MVAETSSPRQNIYGLLEANRKLLTDAIDGMASDQMTVAILGDWSVKDILTHITSWEELILLDLRRIKRGHIGALASHPEEATDKWNEILMSVRRDFPLSQVLFELTETRDAFLSALEGLSNDQMESGYVPGSCQIAALHDWQHTQEISEWRAQEGL